MEIADTVKNSKGPSKNQSRTCDHEMLTLIISLCVIIILAALFLCGRFNDHERNQTENDNSSLYPLIKIACTNSLHPSLCFTTLTSVPITKNVTTPHRFLQIVINHTMMLVANTQAKIRKTFTLQDLNSLEKNAFTDCIDMLDQTLYELKEALDNLPIYPVYRGFHGIIYGNLKTLLSAAMTNECSCIDGFSDLDRVEPGLDNQKKLTVYLQEQLAPISHMISNCLALIKHMETTTQHEKLISDKVIRKRRRVFPHWMTAQQRKMMERHSLIRPDIVVEKDGRGKYRTIGEAINMAPNMSINRFVIKINAGIYRENVEIPRNKVNIMVVGQGMNTTVIIGSRSFLDGFSTFTSATLSKISSYNIYRKNFSIVLFMSFPLNVTLLSSTVSNFAAVVGDRFLARDLTVANTAGPQKHQAVAVRVTSNSAFYRCNFSSYQDTLYAHSLRQFYRECIIEGTIDFIFGNAAAIFQNCLILVRKPNHGQRNMITAQGREDPNQNTGIALQNCTIRAALEFTATERSLIPTYLGRPWRNHSRTIIMKSYLGDLIHPHGWCKWNKYSSLDTIEYIEYMNFGPGSDTKRRVRWAGYKRNCSEDIAKKFTVGTFLRGSDDWLESTGFPLFHDP